MGEETQQFATRFSLAVSRLAALADDAGFAALRARHGAKLGAAVGDALDAVEAVYGTGTEALRDWPEQGKAVLARLGEVRAALARGGVDAEARRLARALVQTIEGARARR